ncbi:hypothetical protein GGX14DRAFT_520924 [Mycena pura]|uniref:Uncharacterized protein n=1 Tax=Mycena pura TaxID=153505 RepID=A0AAD6VDB0_9AGAR|nr:hypothetical protein GGX14DRAFT_520924 [Mycena pura]
MAASDTVSSTEFNKDGSVSKMRSHKGNMPTLPQTKSCPYCSARFTRSTHLTRHVKNHTNERLYRCTTCPAQFTRSDLLARHRKICEDPDRPRLRSCIPCTESKVKCDRNEPCSRCKTRRTDCQFPSSSAPRKKNLRTADVSHSGPTPMPPTAATNVDLSSSSRSGSTIATGMDSDALFPAPENLDPNSNASFLPLGSLSGELADLNALTAQYDNLLPASAPVQSHLSSTYKDDIFQPFFSDVFDPNLPAVSTGVDEFPLSLPAMQQLPLQTDLVQPWFEELLMSSEGAENPSGPSPGSLPATQNKRSSLVEDFFTRELQEGYPKHYVYLFFNAFLMQMPIIHSATFKFEGDRFLPFFHSKTIYLDKPPYLIKAMKACGALFVKTRAAANYITDCLAAAREGLAQAFAKTSMEPVEQVHLVITVVLLQTIGLFHQKTDERTISQSYHAMLVFMIRRAGLISKNSSWVPTAAPGEVMWRAWAFYEMTKRRVELIQVWALILSYLHDCCQSIFFGLPSSYMASEITLRLPCDEELWRAGSAEEWLSLLQISAARQSSQTCLTGYSVGATLSSMMDMSLQFIPVPTLSPFSHFILIHAILGNLFAAFSATINQATSSSVEDEEMPNRTIMAAQYALHNWLHSWSSSRATSQQQTMDEPTLVENVLPFYWLGQVAILAHQEGFPPFNYTENTTGEIRFKMVKRWLKRIRTFLAEGDGESTLFWDELMKIRLQTWQLEYETDGGSDDQDGLLGLFPSTS